MQLEEVPSFNESNDKKATNIVTKETKSARDRRIQLTFERTHTQLEKQMYSKLKKYFFNQRTTILKAVSSIKKTTLENIQLLNSINIWDAENKKLVQTITPLFVETVKAGGQFALNNLGFAEREYILNTQIVQQRANLITGVNKTIFNQIKMEVNEGINLGETIDDITKRIKDVYNTVSSRARTIARTEVTATLNQASLSEYEKNGVQQVEWIAAMDEKTREAHVENANAGPRNIGEAFPSGETYPGQTSPNCRCTISPYIS
jgi:SPP1 gp7 family putative phage head morphogenesis protein